MNRFAVFVDAGYFFAAGGKAAYGIAQRHRLEFLHPETCMNDIVQRASEISGNKNLLRVYWYDALTGTTPTVTQSTIAHLHGVKLRLGVVNRTGEQKGVDSLIVTDLIDLARNRAVIDAVLVTGDEDLRVAVQVAQAYGVRVHILAAGNPNHNVSPALQMEADSVHSLDAEWFKTYLAERLGEQPLQRENISVHVRLGVAEAADNAIKEILVGASAEDIARLAALFATSKTIPGEYDRRLIACTAREVGSILTGDEKRQIRGIFVRHIRERNSE